MSWLPLSDDDLREIRPHTIGDRNVCAQPCRLPPHSRRCRLPVYPARLTAARRSLTAAAHGAVCELAGSTALSARLDPETCARIGATKSACANVIRAPTTGFVAKFMATAAGYFR